MWLMRNGDRLRRALVAHPDLIPIMMRRELLGIGVAELDATAALLEQEGVPLAAIAPILDYGEMLAIVCALAETERRTARPLPAAAFPHLRKAMRNSGAKVDDIFTDAYQAGISAILERVASRQAARSGSTRRAAAKDEKRRVAN